MDYVLRTPDLFLNTSSDATVLREILEAAAEAGAAPSDAVMVRDASRYGIEPLFVRGVSDGI